MSIVKLKKENKESQIDKQPKKVLHLKFSSFAVLREFFIYASFLWNLRNK